MDYQPNDPFPAATHEMALDKLTMEVQQVKEAVDRSIKLSPTNTMASTTFAIGAADRANKLFAFDSAGELSITQAVAVPGRRPRVPLRYCEILISARKQVTDQDGAPVVVHDAEIWLFDQDRLGGE